MSTQVETMQAENSGISPKLRTYGAIRGVTLARETHANGGVTLDLSTPTMAIAEHKTGYYVAGLHKAVMFDLEGSDTRNYQRALGTAYAATQGLGLMGTWVDSGVVYAEASEWYPDWQTAVQVATDRKELAIWSIGSKKCIYI